MSVLSRLFGKSKTSGELLCPHCERAMDAGHDVDACARKRMSRRHFFGVMGGAAAAAAARPRPVNPFAGLFNPRADLDAQYRNGAMSIRMIQSYDPGKDIFIARLDVLYGVSPHWTVRVSH